MNFPTGSFASTGISTSASSPGILNAPSKMLTVEIVNFAFEVKLPACELRLRCRRSRKWGPMSTPVGQRMGAAKVNSWRRKPHCNIFAAIVMGKKSRLNWAMQRSNAKFRGTCKKPSRSTLVLRPIEQRKSSINARRLWQNSTRFMRTEFPWSICLLRFGKIPKWKIRPPRQVSTKSCPWSSNIIPKINTRWLSIGGYGKYLKSLWALCKVMTPRLKLKRIPRWMWI